jgi:type II secretory pathway pseudopilin PulG
MGPRRRRGMTLISLMVGLVVGLLVLSGTLQAYMMISEGARDTLRQARLDQELRAALDVMRLDIRRAGYWSRLALDGPEDPDPLDNPFQRRYGQINNDLCVDTNTDSGDCAAPLCMDGYDSGECRVWVQTGSCLTYGYDSDDDGRIGLRACAASAGESECPRPSGAPFEAANQEPYAWRAWYPPDAAGPSQAVEMEMQGFRWRQGAIDMRVGRRNAADLSFGCNSGSWERLTSPDIRITALRFSVTTRVVNDQTDQAPDAPCGPGDRCRWVRSVGIEISGQLAGEAASRRQLVTRVAVRNDRLVQTP